MKKFSNIISLTLVVTIVCFVLMIFSIIWLVLPKMQTVRQAQENIKSARLELKTKEEYVASLDKLNIQLAEHKEVVDKIKTTLPADPAVPSLLNFLQKAAAGSGLVLGELSPFTVSTSNEFIGLREMTMNLKLVGTFPAFKNFVLNLDRSARLIELEDISFSSVSTDSTGAAAGTSEEESVPSRTPTGTLTFNFKIKTFSY